MTKQEKKGIYLSLALKAERWQFVYIGVSVGFAVSEFALYSTLKTITPLSFGVLGGLAMALINYQIKHWANRRAANLKK